MVFNKNQIIMFNNTAFSPETIHGMSEIHPTTQRLYAAAKQLKDVTGQSAVARLLGISPQVMKNWELRGVSEGGALAAQDLIGCNANWLLQGNSKPQLEAWKPVVSDNVATYNVAKQWPFTTFTRDEYFELLDPDYRNRIENELLGAITRAKQARQTRTGKQA